MSSPHVLLVAIRAGWAFSLLIVLSLSRLRPPAARRGPGTPSRFSSVRFPAIGQVGAWKNSALHPPPHCPLGCHATS
eukprot:3521523-Pyramimonas_sp.AAC.1